MAKIPCIIHHNQLLSTNLQEFCDMWTDDVNRAAKLTDYWTVSREDQGTRLSCLLVVIIVVIQNGRTFHSFQEEEIGELLTKNTARRQHYGRHLLIGEYLQNWTTLYPLNLPINIRYRKWTFPIDRGKHVLAWFKLGIILNE